MGGNALKNTLTRRLARAEFEQVQARTGALLGAAVPGLRVAGIPAYAGKVDFGDLDLMVTTEPLEQVSAHLREQYRFTASGQVISDPTRAAWHAWVQQFAHDTFGASETYPNGDVVSFDYRDAALEPYAFQVDVIAMREANFDYALGYYSYNDLGNLAGRVADQMGLEHGHRGLRYPVRVGTHHLGDIVLTLDYRQALAFLGYDPVRFEAGFDTLEDIFSYVASSEFFRPDIFLLENRDAKSRVRDRKRSTYRAFLAWCASTPGLRQFAYPRDKDAWLARIAQHFPHFQARYDELRRCEEERKQAKARYNGEQVAQWSGLQGMALNRLMERVKEEAGGAEALRAQVLASTIEQLRERVLDTAARMAAETALPA